MSQGDNEQDKKLWGRQAMGGAYLGVVSAGDNVERDAEW